MITALEQGLVQVKLKHAWVTQPWILIAPLLIALMLIGINPANAATASRASAFEYDPVSGLLTKEIIEPDNSDLCLVTTYTYDSFGNKTAATTRNCNGSAGSNPGTNTEAVAPAASSIAIIETRTSSTSYDSQGRFPTSSTNALGQTETKTYNPSFGTVATLTGPNSLSTNWTYDSFGKPLTESRADGTSTQSAYTLCDASCPTVGTAVAKYTVTVTQAGAPYSKTYYDMNGRAIQSETQDKDGALILTQVQFDNLGRTIKTSRPFKVGQSPVWNTVAYDKFNRPVTNTAPNNTVTNVSYNGYTTIATNPSSQTKTEVKNSQGQLVTVTDTQAKSLSYQYDAFGNLTKTTDALGNITTISYDARGRKVGMDDPDQGVWSYQYDALGQLKQQTDAKLQVVSFVYDKLGRMLTRSEPDLISTWAYDTCDASLNPGGKCIGKPVQETTDNGYVRTYLYDAYGRATAELDNVDQGYGVTKSFDSNGRVDTLVYPSGNGIGFSTRNVYTATGHLSEVREVGTNNLFWQAGTTDNEGRVTQQIYGNNVTNSTTFDPFTGRVVQVSAGASNSVSNQSFVYDTLGNLTQRYDAATGLNEAFGYDSLNRLTSTSAQAGAGPLTQTTVTYNAIGNITSKSDIGTYTYASTKANGSIRPHAVSQIMMNDGTTIYGSYAYDDNGNQTSGAGRTMDWNSWNMPSQITGTGNNTPTGTSSSSFQFVYNASHERVKETLPDGTVVYNVSPRVDTGIHVEKRVKTNGEISYNYSMYAGSLPFGVHTVTKVTPDSTATMTNRYYHTDHLGSIIAITDDAGAVVERRSYDAWGKRRNSNGTSLNNAFVTPDVRYAFAGQEDLGEVGLIHMNGRLYDPATGRFISADPTIQMPDDMQNYNRYSYINNNPLSAVDYSGYGFFSSLFKSIVKAAFSIIRNAPGQRYLDKFIMSNKFAYMVGQTIAAYYGGPYGAALYSSYYTYQLTGSISAATRAGLVAFGTAWAMDAVGGSSDNGSWQNIVGHAAVGCASSAASGGSCGSGALAGGFSGAAAGYIPKGLGPVGDAVVSAVIGGTASVIGGGKFENGAMTGAFGYLFNFLQHATFNRATGVLDIQDGDTGQRATGRFFSGTGANDQIAPGDYAILQRGDKDGFRLEAIDSTFGDDVNDGGQSLLRLHGPGRSYGCVTACDGSNWAQVRSLIQNTSPLDITVNTYKSITLPGGFLFSRYKTGTETVKYYGNLRVK